MLNGFFLWYLDFDGRKGSQRITMVKKYQRLAIKEQNLWQAICVQYSALNVIITFFI